MVQRYGCVIVVVMSFLTAVPVFGVDDSTLTAVENQSAEQPYLGQDKATDSIFKYEKKNRNTLLQLKGSGSSRSYADENKGVFGLEALFGQLLFMDGGGFDGFYFLSGKFESDNRFRFNSTFGYFPGFLGGETRVTYRFLNADVLDTLSLDDEVEGLLDKDYSEKASEQGFGLSYKRRFEVVIRELVFDYAYTHLGSERLTTDPFDINTDTVFRRVQADIGFGDVDTHELLVGAALGVDDLDNPVFRGFRLDLQSGYQQADYSSFGTVAGVTDRGFSGGAELKVCTPAGLFKAGYQDSQAAEISSGNYQLGGLDLYYRFIDYPYSEDEEIIGLAFTVDFYDPGASFDRKCPLFFYPRNNQYDSVAQMSHIGRLASDDFTAKPQVRVVYNDLVRVDKTRLPGNVSVDPNNSRLVVRTGCRQVGLRSANPQSASTAFAAGGENIYVSITGLPAGHESVSATFNDVCCGDTVVRITSSAAGAPSITGVNVQEGVGCAGGSPVCLALNAPCNITNDTCCAGTTCQLISSPFGPLYRCLP